MAIVYIQHSSTILRNELYKNSKFHSNIKEVKWNHESLDIILFIPTISGNYKKKKNNRG